MCAAAGAAFSSLSSEQRCVGPCQASTGGVANEGPSNVLSRVSNLNTEQPVGHDVLMDPNTDKSPTNRSRCCQVGRDQVCLHLCVCARQPGTVHGRWSLLFWMFSWNGAGYVFDLAGIPEYWCDYLISAEYRSSPAIHQLRGILTDDRVSCRRNSDQYLSSGASCRREIS